MKSFKQFDETHTVALNSAEDDNLHLANIHDEKVLQRLNGFVGGIAQQEYMQPDAAMKQLNNKLNIMGLNFVEPKIESDKGNASVDVTQFGGRYGKTSDNTTSGEGDIENGDGISHRKENGLKLEFNWEKQANNTYKVFANLI